MALFCFATSLLGGAHIRFLLQVFVWQLCSSPPSWSWCQRNHTDSSSPQHVGLHPHSLPALSMAHSQVALQETRLSLCLPMNLLSCQRMPRTCIHNNCVHPTLKVKIRWNHGLSILKDGVWKAQQVQAFRRMGSGSGTLTKHCSERDHSFESSAANLPSYQSIFPSLL